MMARTDCRRRDPFFQSVQPVPLLPLCPSSCLRGENLALTARPITTHIYAQRVALGTVKMEAQILRNEGCLIDRLAWNAW